MTVMGRIFGAMPLAGAVLLASCGGGGEPGVMHDQQATPGVVVGGPIPNAAPVSTELFVRRAREEMCATTRNRLYLIDGKQVFWDRAGNCGDNSYAQRLYGATPDALLCEAMDSIAGPRTNCKDSVDRAMFDTILANLGRDDLGLGRGHKVEVLPVHQMYRELDRTTRSLIAQPRNVVARDAAAFAALWAEHSGNAAPAPDIDFSRNMVVGVFAGTRANGCHSTEITGIYRENGKITVVQTNWEPGGSVICTMALVNPAHLVVLARSDEPVEFSAQVQVLK